MATTTSLTTTYAGELAGGILAPALLEFVSAKHITVKSNIPYKSVVRKIVDDVTFAAPNCDFTPTGTITLTERIITLEEFEIARQICKKTFFTDWSAKDIMAGNFNAEIQAAILERMIGGAAANMERVVWQGVNGTTGEFDGLGTLIDANAGSDINFVASPIPLTSANILAKMYLLVAESPTAVKGATEKPTIYFNQNTWELYVQALAASGALWNTPSVDANPTFMGLYPIAVCPGIADNLMYMAQKSNLWYGTWLENDLNEVQIIDMGEFGEQNIRFKMRFMAAAQLGITSEIAAYGPGLS